MEVKFNINNVFSKNKVLTIKETEMPMKKGNHSLTNQLMTLLMIMLIHLSVLFYMMF